MKTTLGSILIICFSLFVPQQVFAKPEVIEAEGMRFDVNFSLEENLKILLNKNVSVTVNSGITFTGYVKVARSHLLHLEKLEGKDFYDALIRIDDIQAIDTRFRTLKH